MSGIVDGATLKSLQSRLEKERAQRSVIQSQIHELRNRKIECEKRIGEFKKNIASLSPEKIIMSEHAIIQYLSRVELISPVEVEKKVITEELEKLYKVLGNGEFPVCDGKYSAVIRNHTIITIF